MEREPAAPIVRLLGLGGVGGRRPGLLIFFFSINLGIVGVDDFEGSGDGELGG